MINKLKILFNSCVGYLYKIILRIKKYPKLNEGISNYPKIIVSLTSYGRRVESTVPYAIMSILNQTYAPNKIVLWLDNSWNIDIIPKSLKDLMKYGVEIRFCEDIKSYKKLIPTLLAYPKDIIITIDDDIIYSRNLIRDLIKGYQLDGNIQCSVGIIPQIIKPNQFGPYNDWIEKNETYTGDYLVPIGAGGILYPPNSLSLDVLNKEEFSELAPNADDLWFWVMAKRIGTKHSCCDINGTNYSFDAIYQFFHRGSALTHSNAGDSMNDIQLKQIIARFPL